MQRSWLKYIVSLVVCTGLRLIPGRPPNLEPILATVMPLSKSFGVLDSALFAAVNMVLFDIVTGKVGSWTILTAGTYAIIAAGGSLFLHRVTGLLGYLSFAIIGTLLFDVVTGVLAGPLFYGQPFMEAFLGQIPFTVNHLIGNVALALVLSPVLERWIVRNPVLGKVALSAA